MSNKIYYQFDGTEQVWTSEEYNLELNANQTRSEMGLPYWTDYKIIQRDARNESTNPVNQIDTPSPSNSGDQKPTPVPNRNRKAKARQKAS